MNSKMKAKSTSHGWLYLNLITLSKIYMNITYISYGHGFLYITLQDLQQLKNILALYFRILCLYPSFIF